MGFATADSASSPFSWSLPTLSRRYFSKVVSLSAQRACISATNDAQNAALIMALESI